jgi:FtsZ-binding cell division protein ZapB
LQNKMLLLDSEKAQERMTVELEMTQREVEVLQEAEQRRRAESMGPASANAVIISDLKRHCQLLQSESEELREVASRATRDIEDRDGQISALREENQRLRHRIRQNRERMNGLLDSVSEGSPRSLMGTPHRTPHHNTTPRHIINRPPIMPSSQGREPGAFDALLLADKVLNSQETATAPSTPKTSPLKHRMGHTRNTHSLSSLPTTPSRRPLHALTSALRTPPQLTAIMEPPPSVGQPLPPHFALSAIATGASRRRASSDSTITASSEGDGQMSGSDDDEIPESQASQAATSMLRSTPSSSQKSKARLTQSRIIGKITKPSAIGRITDSEKRRMTSFGGDVQGSPSKRSRADGTAVGLGIGLPPGRGE